MVFERVILPVFFACRFYFARIYSYRSRGFPVDKIVIVQRVFVSKKWNRPGFLRSKKVSKM